MCRAQIEGGARCYSHANIAYQKSLENLAQAEGDLDKKRSIMSQLLADEAALDHAYEDGQVDDETYNRSLDTLILHKERGTGIIASAEAAVERAKKESEDALAEVRTTKTGLINLKAEVEAETDPEKKRTLKGIYNVSRRVNMKRRRAYKEFQKNQELAQVLHEKAEVKKAEAEAIDPTTSPEHAQARDEAVLEYKRLSAEAYLANNNGNMESQALFNAATGDLVPAKLVDGKFGKAWAILSDPRDPNSAAKKLISLPRGKTYASRAAFWKDKGIRLGTVWVPGRVETLEDEFGNKSVIVSRIDGGFYPYAMVCTPDVYAKKIKEEAKQQKQQKRNLA